MPPNILFRTPPSTHFPPLMVNRMFTLFEGWSRAMEQVRSRELALPVKIID